MKLNTVGKLALAGYVGVTGYQVWHNVSNAGNVPISEIIKADVLSTRPLMVLAAVGLFIWFFGRA